MGGGVVRRALSMGVGPDLRLLSLRRVDGRGVQSLVDEAAQRRQRGAALRLAAVSASYQ